MDVIKMKTVVEILKMYYEQGLSQEEIAQRQHLSKSKVNRTIKKAVSDGYIKITVDYPITPVEDLEKTFINEFGLKKAFFAPVIVQDEKQVCKDVCRALANDLPTIVHDDDVIGVSWGNTMKVLSGCIEKSERKNVKIVQLNGSIARNVKSTKALEIIENFTNAFNGIGFILPLPAIVDNDSIVDALKSDSQIRDVFELMGKSRITIFGIGRVSYESVLYSAKYFKEEEYQELQNRGAVGDICARYYDINGKIVDESLDSRTIGIPWKMLKEKEYSIGVASGQDKAPAILGALRGGYVNTLYSDENTARDVLQLYYKQLDDAKGDPVKKG